MIQEPPKKPGIARPLKRLREIERKVPRTIVRIEKKIITFPFQKYFIGHAKPQPPPFKPDWRLWSDDRLTLAWLGHSTVLINFFGTWILTDPVFSERCGIHVGPVTLGPRRLIEAPLQPEDLPPLDLLLISHAHMDHTDPPSLQRLLRAKQVIVAANTLAVYKDHPFTNIRELDWGESILIPDPDTRNPNLGTRVEALEVKHAGWRMPWDPCRSRNEKNGFSYNGYLVEKSVLNESNLPIQDLGLRTQDLPRTTHAIVFGGDTGYTPKFQILGDRMRAEEREIDCAIMPIGTYNPWVEAHANPEQAWRMTQEMNARVIVPVHWNTFVQSSEPRMEPIEWLRSLVDSDDQIALSEHGETWTAEE